MFLRKEGTGLFLMMILSAVLLASCGGGGTAINDLQAGISPDSAVPAAESTIDNNAAGSEFEDLPALPEGLEPARGASAVGDGNPGVRGNDYIRASGATQTDRGLVLKPGDARLAWALYGIDGLADYDVVGLDVDAMPLADNAGYYVAIGNYSGRRWHVSRLQDGPAKIRLPQDMSFISPAGTLYFVVFTLDQAGMLMRSAQVLLDGDIDRPMRRSHAPWGLEASDGTTSGGIALHWNAPRRGEVAGYLVFRRLGRDRNVTDEPVHDRWEKIGRTPATRYFDDNARPGVHYLYNVLAVNDAGHSAHSNVDGGWWGRDTDGTGLFIAGRATTEDGRGVPGIYVRLDGTDRRPVLTNDEGFFVFRNLESGEYVLHAWADNDRLVVRPETQNVTLGDGSVRGIHFIVRRVGDGGGDDVPIRD